MLLLVAGVAWAKDVASVEIAAPPGGLCPGESWAIEGNTLDGAGKARKLKLGRNSEFTVRWELGAVEDGRITMPEDPRAAWGHAGTLEVVGASARATVEVPLRLDCDVVVEWSGRPGDQGSPGNNGVTTQSNGTNGERGQPGEDGEDGPRLTVSVALATDPRTQQAVLEAEIRKDGTDEVRYAVASAEHGTIRVVVAGGPGGRGGNGGTGGDGSATGSGGNGGDGGPGGRGGRGGQVLIVADPAAQPFLERVEVDNAGGAAGDPGNPGSTGAGSFSSNTARAGRMGVDGMAGEAGPRIEVRLEPVTARW